jgi:hypothetical protein
MKLREEGVGATEEENRTIVKEAIIPSIEMLIDMEKEGLLSGGFLAGQRAAAFVISVQDEATADNTIAALPCANIFDVEMVPLEPLKDALGRHLKNVQGKVKAKGGKAKRSK